MTNINLSAVVATYLGRPDMGCVELCVAVLRDLGFDCPDEVDGLGVRNYRELAHRRIRLAQAALLSRLRRVGVAGSVKFPKIGDLLAVWTPSTFLPGGGVYPAVALGSTTAISSFIREGVAVFRIDAANRVIVCRRLPKREAAA
jgi:hypothetical protein